MAELVPFSRGQCCVGGDLDFSRSSTHQSRERGKLYYSNDFVAFFHQGYGQAKVSAASLDVTWEKNIVTQQSMFFTIHC